jgi:hypothetical protein
LNSNALNVAVGWLLPAAVAGVAVRSSGGPLVAFFYLGLTAVSLAMAYYCRGLDRRTALLIVGTYVAFVGALLASVGVPPLWLAIGLLCGMAILARFGLKASGHLAQKRRRVDTLLLGMLVSPNGHKSGPTLVPGWSVRRISRLGFALATTVAVVDAALGSRVLLLGLVSVSPCCVLLTRRWHLTALAGFWAIGLAVLLGWPDGIWATTAHAAFLVSVVVVSLVTTTATFVIERSSPSRP